MAEEETKPASSLIQVFNTIPLGKKISFLVILCVLIGGFVALMLWTNRPNYQVLFSNLETSDAARITEKLKERRIPFVLRDGGRAILVPEENVYDLRLELASEGLPQGGNIGFEVFDKMPFGTTEFVQKLKYQQALQGELARTIMGFDAIAQARVHIVQANESLFADSEKQSTASVVLKLRKGASLSRQQLSGIVNLVACAVKDLRPENVTVVDMDRGLLTGKHEDGGLVGTLTQDQFEYKKRLEQTLQNRIITMLEPVVGRNNVVARVSADVDFRRVSVTEEQYDPDSAVVRSEQRQKEKVVSGNTKAKGSPDLKYQVYQTTGQSSDLGKQMEKESSIINYEINRVNKQIISAVGDIKRLSVAVVIDGPYVQEKDSNGNEVKKFVPRSRRELKNLEDIVKKAMGFDENRGDQVTVSNIAFSSQKETMPVESKKDWLAYLRKAGKPAMNIVLIALFFMFAIKPFKSWLNQTKEYVTSQLALPEGEGVPQLSSGQEGQADKEEEISKEEILNLTKTEPERIAEVIRTWIREES